MPTIFLTAALRDVSGGAHSLEVSGDTVAALLAQLERTHPRLGRWVLDERRQLRQHVNVFVNDERATLETPVGARDEVYIMPAISGGAPDEVEVLVGTRKGLVVLRGRRGSAFEVVHRDFVGQEVEYAMRDPRSGAYFAAATHGQFGPHLYRADSATGPWEETEGPAFPEDTGAAVERIWTVVPGAAAGELWAGVSPAALFRSTDGGLSFELNRGLYDVPGRAEWEGGAGGLCLHSICPFPGDPQRLAVAISAAGVWLTDDGGQSWRRGVEGLVPRYLPPEAQDDAANLCVHNMHRSPIEPDTLYMQFHGGVYRSDDAGETWLDIAGETGDADGRLPADFGFPLVADPRDAARAWIIPLNADEDRVSAGGQMRVFETRDRGATWHGSSAGLPSPPAYLNVLRQAFGHDGREPLGLYFGTTGGDLFASADGGATWSTAARHLPPILSVRVAEGGG